MNTQALDVNSVLLNIARDITTLRGLKHFHAEVHELHSRILEAIDDMKAQLFMDVLHEKDASDKSAFKSDKTREIEVRNRLSKNQRYKVLSNKQRYLYYQMLECERDIAFLDNRTKFRMSLLDNYRMNPSEVAIGEYVLDSVDISVDKYVQSLRQAMKPTQAPQQPEEVLADG